MPPVSQLLAAAVITALAGAVQGTVGFGFSLVAVPLLAIVNTHFVPGPTLLVSVVSNVLVGNRERAHLDLPGLRWAVVGLVPGTVVGALVVHAVSDRGLAVTVAGVVLAAVAVAALPFEIARNRHTLLGAGTAAGFMGTTAGPGGPPIALVYARAPGPTVRSTLAAFFAVSSVLSMAALGLAGHFGWREVRWGVALLPGSLVGYFISKHFHRFVDGRNIRPIVLGLSGASALLLLGTKL